MTLTVKKLIEHLETPPPETLVIRYINGERRPRWVDVDLPLSFATVVSHKGVFGKGGSYFMERDTYSDEYLLIDAIEL